MFPSGRRDHSVDVESADLGGSSPMESVLTPVDTSRRSRSDIRSANGGTARYGYVTNAIESASGKGSGQGVIPTQT